MEARLFNAFARELILTAKQHCAAKQVSSLKKKFKLFDITSQKYLTDFVKRHGDGLGMEALKDVAFQIFPGVKSGDILDAIPKDDVEICTAYLNGIFLAAALRQAEASEETVETVAQAIANHQYEQAEGVVLDDDMLTMIKSILAAKLPKRLSDALLQLRSSRGACQGLGIVELAKDISNKMDLSSLANAQGEQDMSKMFAAINQQVQTRLQSGTVDPKRLCDEAQALLGALN